MRASTDTPTAATAVARNSQVADKRVRMPAAAAQLAYVQRRHRIAD
jgi:hypothetical protein